MYSLSLSRSPWSAIHVRTITAPGRRFIAARHDSRPDAAHDNKGRPSANGQMKPSPSRWAGRCKEDCARQFPFASAFVGWLCRQRRPNCCTCPPSPGFIAIGRNRVAALVKGPSAAAKRRAVELHGKRAMRSGRCWLHSGTSPGAPNRSRNALKQSRYSGGGRSPNSSARCKLFGRFPGQPQIRRAPSGPLRARRRLFVSNRLVLACRARPRRPLDVDRHVVGVNFTARINDLVDQVILACSAGASLIEHHRSRNFQSGA